MVEHNGHFEVVFQPGGERATVAEDGTVLDAARAAGVRVNTACGGDGLCGKCKVIVRRGSVWRPSTALLTPEDVQQGYTLACKAHIQGDAVIEVPAPARVQGGRILVDSAAAVPPGTGDPLVRKVHLRLAPPTIQNSAADYERVCTAVRKATGHEHISAGGRVLQSMHDVLQSASWEVTATVADAGPVAELLQLEPGDTTRRYYAVAVDIGTTTVAAALLDLRTGQTVDTAATYNSQMACGDDYIRRIIYAETHDAFERMQRLVVDDINGLITALAGRAGIDVSDITGVLCCGNTAMIHFLLKLPPQPIRRAPYVPVATFVPPLHASDVGLQVHPGGMLWCLPGVAAYVGSDVAAGAVAIGMDETDGTWLFIDVGTNGEVVLGNREWMVCCSASAGPAFEGGGVACGMRAERGAIEHVRIARHLHTCYSVVLKTIGDAPPRGICGTGLIDALAQMREAGILDRAGHLQPDHPCGRIRTGDSGYEFVLAPRSEPADDGRDVVLTQADIDNLIRSKAAVYAAAATLVKAVGVPFSEIDRIVLAGGFGSYLDPHNAIMLGLLPPVPADRVSFAGNTSLAGAKLALCSKTALRRIEQVARRMTYLDLMTDPTYMEAFQAACFIPHTNAPVAQASRL